VLLSRLADELADRLRGLPGTKKVQVYGVADEEILVEIDPARLRPGHRHG
jgi:multidrug efflux pump